MSEYQYYEFRAIDRPLDQRAMDALRAITSRAEITPTSLVNEYHWGDFKGDPDKLMDRYFDAHLYVANWGTHRLMLRLPARVFPLARARPYAVPEFLRVRGTKEHVVLDFRSEDEYYDFEEAAEGWLAALIPLRSDLMAGDLRCLYLGWLAGVEIGEVDPDEAEPPVPPGLGKLSAPLKRFAEFMRVDADLLEVAAAGAGGDVPSGPSTAELAGWVAALPAAEKDGLLVRLMEGEGALLGGELLLRFREAQARARAGAAGGDEAAPRRTAGALLAERDRRAEERQRREAERAAKAQAKRAREQAAAHDRHLADLANREGEAWRDVEAAIQTRLPKEYDRAVGLLKDLRDLAERSGTTEEAARRIRALRERHRHKPTLMKRLNRAGLP